MRTLHRTRKFIDVLPKYVRVRQGVVVVFTVVERPTLRYVKFVGNERVTTRTLRKKAEIDVGDSIDSYVVEEARRRVESYYHEKGYDFLAMSDYFFECYDYPLTDTRTFRSEDFTTLIAAELHAGKLLNDEMWHVLAVGLPLDLHQKMSVKVLLLWHAGRLKLGLLSESSTLHGMGCSPKTHVSCHSLMPWKSITMVPRWRTIAETVGAYAI